MQSDEIIDFWFAEIDKKFWFVKDDSFDQLLVERFSAVHQQAIQGELFEWRHSATGRLAEVIILDQFSRNMFRGTAQSFAYDSMALVLAQEAIGMGADSELPIAQRNFLYMPFMHSESLVVHNIAMNLFSEKSDESTLSFEIRHKEIIDKFGRYPHRNEILNRQSTDDELEFLNAPNSGF